MGIMEIYIRRSQNGLIAIHDFLMADHFFNISYETIIQKMIICHFFPLTNTRDIK